MAWHPLGWKPAAFAQHDPDHKGKGPDFASAVLQFHYPDVPNLGDVTKADFDAIGPVDLVVFGSPCQSYSVAGKRLGLDDPRGNLALIGGQIVYRKRARWFVFENVPGLLSSDSGWDFGTLLAAFAGYPPGSVFAPPDGGWRNAGYVQQAPGGYGLAWRVLDAQFVRVDGFGRAVPQRRRRVFVVGYLGDWRRAAAVLFERSSMSGDSAPRRRPGKDVAGAVVSSAARRGGVNEGERGGLIPETARPLYAGGSRSGGGRRPGTAADDVESLVPEVATPLLAQGNRTGGDRPPGSTVDTCENLVPIAFGGNNTQGPIEVATACRAHHQPHKDFESETFLVEPIVFDETQITHPENRSQPQPGGPSHPLAAGARPPAIAFDCKAGGQTGLAIGEVAGALHGEGHGGGRAAVLAWQNRFRGDDGRGYTRAPMAMEDVAGTLDTVKPWHVAAPAYGLRSDAPREGKAKTPSPDAEGRVRLRDPGFNVYEETSPTMDAGAAHIVSSGWVVRRLTCEEGERLQGFPDEFTNIPWRGRNGSPDGPRYKALGNSMAVNVMAWIGRRIEMVEGIVAKIEGRTFEGEARGNGETSGSGSGGGEAPAKGLV